ncbi:MAG: nucleoside hydrolase [Candidatus Abyssobacteria bacterium SURF_17]|uniref:Nucleoside hydrolase n=1 Tax=Candidatus Abyssobacteria bacterium SURF_17 TaxID=2093361 RepID=A0A419F1N0_9BACT|nr:MAG: nucleoside hydrolase [Candidatus Abyssubacteria bacterium SURF_17]
MTQRIIFDTDIGTDVDDAYALSFLAHCPEVHIEAVTTVWADPLLRARIARKLLNLLGKPHIPVAVGESAPLNPARAAFLMGNEGRGVLNGNENLRLSEIPATALIESLLKKYPHEIKVLLMGPETNMGKLLSEKPELAALVKEFVIMGGMPFYSPKEMALIGERPVEFNLTSDPEAARTVFESGVPITMVGANVTFPTLLKQEHIERIRNHGAPATDLLHSMTIEWLKVFDLEETSMHDPLAASAAFTLEFLDTMMLNVAVETKGEFTTGLTVVNRCNNADWNTVRVATEARSIEFINFMLKRILV